ncbi:hypothetical protein HD806DRAFT_270236 [Xylariaceae sp. AK1471]|nr:hypothetical protein HD806DRAFT_270236 [Xylariaceae sp. AK1471]
MTSNSLPVIIRLIPIISSTSSLWYAWDQYEQMTLFRKTELKPLSSQILPQYFTSFFARGTPRVLGLLLTTALSCGVILQGTLDGDNGASPWYVAGLSLATAHVAWAPFVIRLAKAIGMDAKEKSVVHLEEWLRLHVWRSLTVDLGAWVCCTVATVKALS